MTETNGAPGTARTEPEAGTGHQVDLKHPRVRAQARRKTAYMSVSTVGMLTAAAVVTSLRGLPVMGEEELTMFFYIGFATILFLIPAALVSAELGSAFSTRGGGVYTWVGEAFGQRWGFVAIWLQWIQNVVWYPTGLSFAAAAIAYGIGDSRLANSNLFVGVFCIVAYWLATLLALRGTSVIAKVAKYGFIIGTVVPGVVLIGLFVYWVASGHALGWTTTTNAAVSHVVHGQTTPRYWPQLTGLGSLAFLGNILLLFAGVEAQAVHVRDMRNPRRGFPAAMLIAAVVSVALFTLGALSVAGIVPYAKLQLQTGIFSALGAVLSNQWNIGWALQILALMICFGALGGALAWLTSPSRGLLSTAHDGVLPPFMQKTNRKGVQKNILIIQAVIVTVISALYLVLPDVSGAFFLISSMTITLYIVMYLLMYAAAIRLRYTQPNLPRAFSIPGGKTGMWVVAGIGFLAVAFALVVCFFPPAQLAIGTPALYIALVAGGLVVFIAAPLVIYQFRRPSWKNGSPDQLPHEASFHEPATAATRAAETPPPASLAATGTADAIPTTN